MSKHVSYQTILDAKAGDSEAISSILKHYTAYISAHSKRPFFDENGNRYELVDEEIYQRIEAKLIYQIINRFDPFQHPNKDT